MRLGVVAALAFFSIAGLAGAGDAFASVKRHTAIAAQGLGPALQQLASERDVQFVYRSEIVGNRRTDGASGELTFEEALTQLLEGTGLTYQFLGDRAITIIPLSNSTSRLNQSMTSLDKSGSYGATSVTDAQSILAATGPNGAGQNGLWSRFRLAQVDQQQESGGGVPAKDVPAELNEIVITGTHIRGVSPASPVITVDEKDILRAGQQTSGDVIRALPQNFSGGLNPGVVQAGGAQNIQQGTASSTANLRGLGSDSTLTVVNGRRLAYTELGSSVDVSLIPLQAIERVEVLTDGASALYGAEAIAGVVNVILRDRYDGVTLDAVVGTSTEGGGDLQRYGVLAGTTWSSGAITGSYEYLQQDEILASDRDFTAPSVGETTLIPEVERHSVFASAHQEVTPEVKLSAVALYSERDARRTLDLSFFLPGGVSEDTANVEQHGVVVGAEFRISETWQAAVFGTVAGNRQRVPQVVTLNGVEIPGGIGQSFETDLGAVDAVADGVMFHLPTGPVRLALGAGYRDESFSYASIPVGFLNSVEGERDVEHFYAEALVPITPDESNVEWPNTLSLSIAGRYDSYSDVGSTTNPKFGIVYEPHRDLEISASWGTSFRAPSLFQSVNPSTAFLSPNPAGGSPFLLLFGGNPSLEPETAESFTTSIRFAPATVPGLSTQITYFDLDYEDRIAFPFTNTTDPASDPAAQPFILFNPAAAQVNAILAESQFINPFGLPFDPAAVAYIADDRVQNVTRTQASGWDLLANYESETEIGELSYGLNVAYLEIRQRATDTSDFQTISGTVFNPPELRVRGSLGLERGRFSASVFVNYQDGSTDEAASPSYDVDSWTTCDLTLSYEFGDSNRASTRVSMAATNLFDEEPPFVNAAQSGVPGLNYDSTNASAVGRFLTLQLTQRF